MVKVKGKIKPWCQYCFIKRRKGRLYNYCSVDPRHKHRTNGPWSVKFSSVLRPLEHNEVQLRIGKEDTFIKMPESPILSLTEAPAEKDFLVKTQNINKIVGHESKDEQIDKIMYRIRRGNQI